MQKKIIVLALAAAFTAPAFADTPGYTVYGAVNLSVESMNNGDSNTGTAGSSALKVSSNVTKLGFKGAQDLGDGVSAIWQIEQQIDVDNASSTAGAASNSTHNTLATRNSFAGLSDSAMGTIMLGKMDSPYKTSTRSLDAFGDSLADNRSLLGGGTKGTATSALKFDEREGNSVVYNSPDFGGVKVAVAYIAGAEDATGATVNKGSAISMNATYSAGNLYAGLGYQSHTMGDVASGTIASNAAAAGQKETAAKLGVGYKLDALYLSAIYEKTTDTLNAGAALYGHSAMYVAAKYDLSDKNTVKVAYGKIGEINNAADTGASQTSLGFDHKLAKTTSVYALYSAINNGDKSSYGFVDAGSTGGGFAATGTGAKFTAFAMGMKHAF